MDTTPKYVKMCEQAEGIQKLYQEILQQPRETGRKSLKCWVVARTKGVEPPYAFSIQLHVFALINYPANLIDCIWLPRQDQLQKMVCNKPKSGDKIIDRHLKFHNWFINGIPDTWVNNLSFEQLWLAFVMHEKYGKHWDNKKEEWVK